MIVGYFIEQNNKYSIKEVIAKSNKIVVGQVPKALAEKLFSLMKQLKFYKVKATILGGKNKKTRRNLGPREGY